jgi:hypothetical protein
MAKSDYCLPINDGNLSGESGANLKRNKSLKRSIRRSLRKRPQWKLLEQ